MHEGRNDITDCQALIAAAGTRAWTARMQYLAAEATLGPAEQGQYSRRALLQRHAVEITLERLRQDPGRIRTPAEDRIVALAAEAARVLAGLSRTGRAAMRTALRQGLAGANTLIPLLHLVRTAALQRARGFEVRFAGFEDAATFDLLIKRGGVEAEIACDVISAEEGRDVHRGAWVNLLDRVDPDLQTWLAAHPGRYILKLTLPQGLRRDQQGLAALHGRIRTMLEGSRRADHDEAAVLRLDPLMLAGSQAAELGLMSSLRQEFGHEAHLAVTSAGGGVFVLAARAGRANEVAVALRRRLAEIAPIRLTGDRPGILAMFVEDTDRAEWTHLRERLELEGEARQFLAHPESRRVVAVTCRSRIELLGPGPLDGHDDGELRFRNPAHPAAKAAALAPAVLSSN